MNRGTLPLFIHALTLSGPSWENTPSVFSKFTLIRGVYRELWFGASAAAQLNSILSTEIIACRLPDGM